MPYDERRIPTSGLVSSDILDIVSSDRFLSRLPTIEMVSPVLGGVAHCVYFISSEKEK